MKIDKSNAPFCLQSKNVCMELGISRDSLYAYVSRGLLRRIADPLDARKSLYHEGDVEALRARQKRARSREEVAASTIDWGEPVLQSSITEIRDQDLFYRGFSAVQLSRQKSFEEVFELLVKVPIPTRPPKLELSKSSVQIEGATPIYRLTRFLANESGKVGSSGGGGSAKRLLLSSGFVIANTVSQQTNSSIAETLANSWCPDHKDGASILNAALILCADHELNASTYAARIAASARANLPSCLLSGIATLSGDAHGGATNLARAWEKEASKLLDDSKAMTTFIQSSCPPGFGHPFYPDGDPRAKELLRIASIDARWRKLIQAVFEIYGVWPTLDFSLAIIEDTLELPEGSGLGIFALGRVAGWTAHIFEQRKSGRLIRPRARYKGPNPKFA